MFKSITSKVLKAEPRFDEFLTGEAATVELTADEFHRVYNKVKETILTELGLDSENIEGNTLIDRCRRILEQGGHDEDTHFDFHHGFLPLYERLHRAKKDGGESGYRLVFA